jgi:hypothetical protein
MLWVVGGGTMEPEGSLEVARGTGEAQADATAVIYHMEQKKLT